MPSFDTGIIFNIIVAIIFVFYWTAAFTLLYHLTRFGVGTQPKKLAAVFLFGSLIFASLVLILYLEFDSSILKLVQELIRV